MLKLFHERQVLELTVDQTENVDLLLGQARAFAENLLKERGKLDKWVYDGAQRRNYNRVIVFFVR